MGCSTPSQEVPGQSSCAWQLALTGSYLLILCSKGIAGFLFIPHPTELRHDERLTFFSLKVMDHSWYYNWTFTALSLWKLGFCNARQSKPRQNRFFADICGSEKGHEMINKPCMINLSPQKRMVYLMTFQSARTQPCGFFFLEILEFLQSNVHLRWVMSAEPPTFAYNFMRVSLLVFDITPL